MKKQHPFIIQFARLEDFIQECQTAEIKAVRVWSGVATIGSSNPGHRYHSINVQAIDTEQAAVFSLFLIVGSYHVIYGKPFGPQAERQAQIIEKLQEDACDRVKAYLGEHLPGIRLHKGQIYTGLTANDLQRAGWDGFDDIYQAQKPAEEA